MAMKSKIEREMVSNGLMIGEVEQTRLRLRELMTDYPAEIRSQAEKNAYREIYLDNPSSHLFTKAVEPLMVEYIRAKIGADDIAAKKAALSPGDTSDLYFRLSKQQKDYAQIMSSLATKLRITPSAVSGYRGGPKTLDSDIKPWEEGKTAEDIIEFRKLLPKKA